MSDRNTLPDRWFQPPRPEFRSCDRCGVRVSGEARHCKPCTQRHAIVGDVDWMADGLCAQVDPELWFPEPGGHDGTIAKRICNGYNGTAPCPVRDQCLKYALANAESAGVWGGTSEKDRRALRNEERAA